MVKANVNGLSLISFIFLAVLAFFGFKINPLEQYYHVTINKNTNRNSATYAFLTRQRTQKTIRGNYLVERGASALVLDIAERTLVWALRCWNAETPRWNSAEPLRNVWCAAALHMSFPSPLEKVKMKMKWNENRTRKHFLIYNNHAERSNDSHRLINK